jgi:hypothetical protein
MSQQMLNGERRRPTFEKRPRRGGLHGKHVFGHVIVEHVLCGEHADEQIARPVLEVTDAAFELANLRSSEGRRFVGMRPLHRNDTHLAKSDRP